MGTIPIQQLEGGETITPRVPITDERVRHWKYATECAALRGTLIQGVAHLTIGGISKNAGAAWVRARIPGRDPVAFLKIAGEEYAAAFDNVAGTRRQPELVFNLVETTLRGTIDGQRIEARAGSGGRAGSTTPGAASYALANNPLATHIGGAQSAGTHNYGPIPQGRYTLWPHETNLHKIRLQPSAGTPTNGRDALEIHKPGPIGSHGCIVPSDGHVVDAIARLVRKRTENEEMPVLLQVIAVGFDPDRKFRTALNTA